MPKYDERCVVRCVKKDFNDFRKWCVKVNKTHQEIIREVIKAAPEGRLRIDPNEYQRKMTGESCL